MSVSTVRGGTGNEIPQEEYNYNPPAGTSGTQDPMEAYKQQLMNYLQNLLSVSSQYMQLASGDPRRMAFEQDIQLARQYAQQVGLYEVESMLADAGLTSISSDWGNNIGSSQTANPSPDMQGDYGIAYEQGTDFTYNIDPNVEGNVYLHQKGTIDINNPYSSGEMVISYEADPYTGKNKIVVTFSHDGKTTKIYCDPKAKLNIHSTGEVTKDASLDSAGLPDDAINIDDSVEMGGGGSSAGLDNPMPDDGTNNVWSDYESLGLTLGEKSGKEVWEVYANNFTLTGSLDTTYKITKTGSDHYIIEAYDKDGKLQRKIDFHGKVVNFADSTRGNLYYKDATVPKSDIEPDTEDGFYRLAGEKMYYDRPYGNQSWGNILSNGYPSVSDGDDYFESEGPHKGFPIANGDSRGADSFIERKSGKVAAVFDGSYGGEVKDITLTGDYDSNVNEYQIYSDGVVTLDGPSDQWSITYIESKNLWTIYKYAPDDKDHKHPIVFVVHGGPDTKVVINTNSPSNVFNQNPTNAIDSVTIGKEPAPEKSPELIDNLKSYTGASESEIFKALHDQYGAPIDKEDCLEWLKTSPQAKSLRDPIKVDEGFIRMLLKLDPTLKGAMDKIRNYRQGNSDLTDAEIYAVYRNATKHLADVLKGLGVNAGVSSSNKNLLTIDGKNYAWTWQGVPDFKEVKIGSNVDNEYTGDKFFTLKGSEDWCGVDDLLTD